MATGGGVVLRNKNWGVLHRGIIIWLDPARDVLLKRLRSDRLRPLLKNQNTTTIDNLLTLRIPFYREADLHILINDESVELIVQKVLEGLTKLINAQEDSF